MTEVIVMPSSAERPIGMTIEIDSEIPFAVLCRVVGDYGVIRLCRTGPVVVPIDSDSGKWISVTLAMLGFTSTTKEISVDT